MKNRTIKTIIAAMITMLLVGCNSITAQGQETVEASNIDSIQAVNKLIALNEYLHKWNHVEVFHTYLKGLL